MLIEMIRYTIIILSSNLEKILGKSNVFCPAWTYKISNMPLLLTADASLIHCAVASHCPARRGVVGVRVVFIGHVERHMLVEYNEL